MLLMLDGKTGRIRTTINIEKAARLWVDVLRKGDVAELRNLLRALRENPDSNAKALYNRLVQHPALRDLVAH